ncbi:GDP-mannose 4,6-dehydratase [Alistipes sp.]|uniref:GDP-mannose 4,6-dehydratase n=1 Tax=Alistipes sp. TaxID=1872444 RepID=UPI003AEF852A
MQKRIVVLGGVGFIGTHLCLRLLDEGHEVFCVDVRDAANSPLLRNAEQHPTFRYVHHNIINSFGIRCDEIYNLASPSMVRYNKALPVETLKVNVLGSINALDTARTERARVLFASSGDVYGSDLRMMCDGATGCSTHSILAEGKRAAEALHRAYQAEFGVDTRIARIFNTYGSGADLMDQRMVIKTIVAALQNRDILINGSGEQLRTFCWVEDIVDGLIRLMESPAAEQTRTVDLGSNRETSIRALAEKIVALTGSRSRILHVKDRPDDRRRLTPDITTARRELGWAPRTPLLEGLRRTISYVEKELSDKACASLTWAEMN